MSYYIAQIVTNVINPHLVNPTAGDWKGKTGFFWGGWSLAFLVWTYCRCPELKDRTYEESAWTHIAQHQCYTDTVFGRLDILCANKISARKFASTSHCSIIGHSLQELPIFPALRDDLAQGPTWPVRGGNFARLPAPISPIARADNRYAAPSHLPRSEGGGLLSRSSESGARAFHLTCGPR